MVQTTAMVSAVSARDTLVLDHQGVARAAALEAARRWKVSADDLCQEAFIALIIAAERYDPNRGAQFATYAVWVIRGRLKTAIERELRHSQQATFTERKPNSLGHQRATYTNEAVVRLDDPVGRSDDADGETRLSMLESPFPSPEDLHMGRELAAAAELALASAMRQRGRLAAALALNRLSDQPRSPKQIAKRFGVGERRVRSLDAEVLALARTML